MSHEGTEARWDKWSGTRSYLAVSGRAGSELPEEGHSLVAAALAAALTLVAMVAVLAPLRGLLAVCRARLPRAQPPVPRDRLHSAYEGGFIRGCLPGLPSPVCIVLSAW